MLWPVAKEQVVANVVVPVLAIAAVVLRVIARRRTKLGLHADDYVIFATLIIALAMCATGIWAGATNVIGKDLFSMTLKEYSMYSKILRIDALLCYIAFALVKISVLLFYQRVFPVPKFKWVCYITIGIVSGFSFGAIMAQVFSQKPYDRGWDLPADYSAFLDYRPNFDFVMYLVAVAVVNMTLDVIVLTLPIPLIASLHMCTAKRLSVFVIFGTGAFCVIASAVRMYYCIRAYQALHFIKQPYTITQISSWNDMWGHIEVCASIVTACLPTLAPLFKGQDPNSSKLALFFAFCAQKLSSYRKVQSGDTESQTGSPKFLSLTKGGMTVIATVPTPSNTWHGQYLRLPAQPQLTYIPG